MANTSGDQLRKRRERKRISLRKLAREAGLSPSYLSDIELGRSTCPADTMERLTTGLNILARA